jgi:hypothetical protein
MKNILVVILLFFCICAFLFGVYFAGVRLYFNDAKTLSRANYFVRSTLQREMTARLARVNPLGYFVLKDARIASRGGFSNGVFLSFESLKISLSLANMLKGVKSVKSVELSGLSAVFNFKKDNPLIYQQFFQNFSGNILENFKKFGIIYEKIIISNAKIEVIYPEGVIVFTNINFESRNVNLKNDITGKITGNISAGSSAQYFEAEIIYNFTENSFKLMPLNSGLPLKVDFYPGGFLVKNAVIAADKN